MSRYIVFLVSVVFLAGFEYSFGQSKSKKENFKENHSPFGRRKKEKKNQKRLSRGGSLFRRHSSGRGNANQFAAHRILGRKSFLASLFNTNHNNNASLRKTKPASRHDERALFKRQRTGAKNQHTKIQKKQQRRRDSTRKRGNVLFQKRKR